ncbi:50S ribosomal protein L15, chloroplastic [Sesamum angolense]|uniref:50S ribosomal protein L15, chloroplastic n=1 Tax=Sesamum angolense TaxID=2727404 RepID=A0AAE2C5X7_9LAMI|nr:50S ribosomal protein L15, chloroplastic [Sesamum angolense]
MSGSVWITWAPTWVPVESEEKRERALGWARELRVWNEGSESQVGPGVRKGFEGGQMPLYRRIPLLREIAGGAFRVFQVAFFSFRLGGAAFIVVLVSSDSSDIQVIRWTNGCMHAGLPKYVPLNLKDIADAGFKEGEEVSLESLKMKGLINPSGRDRGLPLKILGNGELRVKLNFKARAFSESAKEKLKAAGCSLTILPGQTKWVKPSGAENIARAEEYFAKKRASSESDDSPST